MNSPGQDSYGLGAQTAHQPFALTAFPGKIWHGRHASPSAPWTSAQFAHVCTSAGLARVAGSTDDASSVYFMDDATGSLISRCGMSCAMASEPGRTMQPAAATAENFKNWRLAILLNGISLIYSLCSGPSGGDAYLSTIPFH